MIDEAAKERLSCFRESIIVPLARTDADKWPIRSGRISRLCLDEFSREFFEDIEHLREQHESASCIAKLFHTPSHLWRMSHHLLNGLRLLSEPLEVQQRAMLTVLALIEQLKYKDLFCQSGANILLPPDHATAQVKTLQSFDEPGAARLVHQLAGVLWAYAESLYFVAHELGVEIHGPYVVSDKHVLLVRDFFDLHPYPLWPAIDSFIEHRTVRILVLYNRVDMHLDVYNNLYIEPGKRLLDEAVSCLVLIDGHVVDRSAVQQLIVSASKVITDICNMVNSWSLEEIVRQYIRIFWWRKKALSEAVHRCWEPPAQVQQRVIQRNIPDASFVNPSEEELRQQYNLL